MPGYKGHLSGGLLAGGLAIGVAVMAGRLEHAPLYLSGLLGFCLLGALFPDVDTDSKGQNFFYAVLILVDGALIYKHYYHWAAWLGLYAMLPAIGHHRGWTHTWWAMALVGTPILIIPGLFFGAGDMAVLLPFYIAFTLGYFSHLLMDRKLF
jgi:membrane-bound metal-dependent hydrolase YbcI (DUF457 family)